MSPATTAVRHTCQNCRERKARLSYPGRVRADRHHALCFECFRAERNRPRARRLAEVIPAAPVSAMTSRQIAHRRAMLAHAEQQSRRGY